MVLTNTECIFNIIKGTLLRGSHFVFIATKYIVSKMQSNIKKVISIVYCKIAKSANKFVVSSVLVLCCFDVFSRVGQLQKHGCRNVDTFSHLLHRRNNRTEKQITSSGRGSLNQLTLSCCALDKI